MERPLRENGHRGRVPGCNRCGQAEQHNGGGNSKKSSEVFHGHNLTALLISFKKWINTALSEIFFAVTPGLALFR
jgi:hypothetical protein